MASGPLPAEAGVVVIGGGIIGASIAYHLALDGVDDVCLLERGQLTCGTTWHAAGLVAELRASPNLTRLARYSGELYEKLEAEGEGTGFSRVGALTLSTAAGRTVELQRQASMARQNGVECQWLAGAAIAERWPELNCADVAGGVYMPRDGQTNPVDTTQALARRARQAGAHIFEGVSVTAIDVQAGAVRGVRVVVDGAAGYLGCREVVLAAGLWSRELAAGAGAVVPLYPAEHFYAVTEPLPAAAGLPIVRVPDSGIYLKPDAGRLLVGCFERQAKPVDPASLPDDFAFDEFSFDLDHFAPYLASAAARLPALEQAGIRTWFNGPESFTPDGRYILGQTPEVSGLFAACGFNSIGIQSAGGVGQVMSRWIRDGRPPMDLWEVDVRRFFHFQNDPEYLVARTAESLGLLYAMHWPHRQFESARNVRRSPLHERLQAEGACFGELAGWERANWFGEPGTRPVYEYSYARQNWFDHAAHEHRSVRRSVALFDQTSFAKYRIAGPQAGGLLDRLSTANLNVAVGRVVYCQWLNERGGIEADVTITRVAEDCYWVVSAAACQRRDLAWLGEHGAGFDVQIDDVTDDYAVLGLMGPKARTVLGELTGADLAHQRFPFASSREIRIADRLVRASRITYVGALGWELYVKREDALAVYDALMAHDRIAHAGYHAMDSLRLEKAYRHWGHDIGDEDSPLEAGLSFTVSWEKSGGFIGLEALREQKAAGLTRRLALFTLQDPDALLYHDEPIWRDGRPVGYITSGAWGHSINAAVGFGYVRTDHSASLAELRQGAYEIEVAGQRLSASIATRALYDPDNLEIRS